MPEIHVFCAAGRTREQKRNLMRSVTQAVATEFGVDPELVTVQILESPASDKARGGKPFDERAG